MRAVTPMAQQLSDGMMYQSDMDLVREGAPAFLLLLDALVEAHPDHPALLLAAAEARLAYASGFLDDDQRDRVRAMYAQARDHGVQALSRNRHFARALDGSIDDFEEALQHFRKREHTLMNTMARIRAQELLDEIDEFF